MENLNFLKNLKKHKFAHISATVRDRVKRTKFVDHSLCRRGQQNIFQHFENFKNFKNISKFNFVFKNLIFFKNIKNCSYLRNGLR